MKQGSSILLAQTGVRPAWIALGLFVTLAMTGFAWLLVHSSVFQGLITHPAGRHAPLVILAIGGSLIVLDLLISRTRSKTPFALVNGDHLRLPRLQQAFDPQEIQGICFIEFHEKSFTDEGRTASRATRACAMVVGHAPVSVIPVITRMGGIRPVRTVRRWAEQCGLRDIGTIQVPSEIVGQAAALRFTQTELTNRQQAEMS